jgi:hydroxypyruvate isomerase
MRLSASVTFMFTEHPLLERFAAAREAGFDGVEIQRLAEGNAAEMARAAREAGVDVVLVNVPSGDWASGGPGLSGVPGREDAFREAFGEALEAATLLGARHIHLGPSRLPKGATPDECLAVYLSNVRVALGMSRAASASLLVEAMNPVDAPTALFSSTAAAAGAVRTVGDACFGLQFDIYHAAMNGDDPVATFAAHRPLVRHVQFSDVPGRHEPGSGRLDIPAILAGIVHAGYAGWAGAEYWPSTSTEASLGWMDAVRGALSA